MTAAAPLDSLPSSAGSVASAAALPSAETVTSAPAAPAAPLAGADRKQGYLVGPAYDWIFFLAPPLAALALAGLLTGTRLASDEISFFGNDGVATSLFIGIFIHAHLVAVFFRSHGNPKIAPLYPVRFAGVPVVLLGAMIWSPWVFVFASVLATFWDVYHSGLQTFGFARLYDRAAGNDPKVGRRLDYALNLLLYAGPIVAGATMMDHFEDFYEFERVGSAFFTSIPVFMDDHQYYFTLAVLGAGGGFLFTYVGMYWSLAQRGYRVAWRKVFLLTSTGFVSIYAWGFNSWGEAFFIMNFFHALQYFGLVWWSEQKNIASRLGVAGRRWGKALALTVFLGVTFTYGAAAELLPTSLETWWALTIVVSLMHFWYDGFVWSVRKRQV